VAEVGLPGVISEEEERYPVVEKEVAEQKQLFPQPTINGMARTIQPKNSMRR
jgi:hypothetical protein